MYLQYGVLLVRWDMSYGLDSFSVEVSTPSLKVKVHVPPKEL
jgi:hypothetical protein